MSEAFPDGATSRSTPVVHDGLMFLNAGQRVYALDATSGKRIWSWLPDERRAGTLTRAYVLASAFRTFRVSESVKAESMSA